MSETLAASTPSTLPGPLRREARPDTEAPAPTESRSPVRRLTRPLRQVFLGSGDDPRWARPLLWVLLLGTAALYLFDLSNSGTANDFYAAAVKSGTESLKAWLFGSLDSANSITVDKPPASLWLMVLSARIFGFSSFSTLLPQALLGVGSVALLYAAVRRWVGPAAGLIAGVLLALTPIAALMFRFNNPDAMLVFLMVAAAYCVVRAIDALPSGGATPQTPRGVPVAGAPETRVVAPKHSRALRWMLLAGSAIGFAFLTKMAQGLLVLPAFGLVYLVASPLRLRARIGHLLAAAGALIVSAGWFIALVELWPAAARPYIGGSSNNSLWELAIGYNGLSRLLGGAGNGGGGGGGNAGFGGSTGLLRMFGSAFGTQISWFLPAALLGLVSGLVLTRRAPRTDKTRAALLLWGAWLVVSTAVFSFMSGTIHPYYSVALAPAIGALVAIGGRQLWIRRSDSLSRGVLAIMIGGTAVWGSVLMIRDASGWLTWLAYGMGILGVLGSVLLAVSAGKLKRFAVAALLVSTIAAASGAASFTVATVATGHTGSIPTAGPSVVTTSGMGGGGFPGSGTPPSQTGTRTNGTTTTDGTTTTTTGGQQGGSQQGGSASNTELVALLNGTSTRWSAAVIGDQSAAGYILSTDTAVMAIGGWSGSDSSPTLAEFQAYVANGQIRYFIAGGNAGGGGGQGGQGGSTSSASAITAWVEANYTATTVGGTTVYDLTAS